MSCRQQSEPEIQGSAMISGILALRLGSISSMRPIICLLSFGNRRSRRNGPLITSGFFSTSVFFSPFVFLSSSVVESFPPFSDLDNFSASEVVGGALMGEGGDAKSLYELSVIRGFFQGNLRSDMQQKMMASDQISAGCGSYFRSSSTSGAR